MVDFIDRCASTHGIVFTEDVVDCAADVTKQLWVYLLLNGLRLYFPRGTDFSRISQSYLNAIALRLVRERPWASKRHPINYKRCCTDRLNAQGQSGSRANTVNVQRSKPATPFIKRSQDAVGLNRIVHAPKASRNFRSSSRVVSSVNLPSVSNFSFARKTSSSGCGIA